MEITIKWTVDFKSDEEAKKKVKALFNAAYGDLAATPLPDWDPEALQTEIQDLKLENDRLKQRDAKMLRALKSICCDGMNSCDGCLFKEHKLKCESSCSDIAIAKITLKELEDL